MHTRTGSRNWLFAIALISFGGHAPYAWADNTADTSQPATLDTVTVTAAKLRSLEQFTPTGSRLGLSAQELPATLEVIDNDEMLAAVFSTFSRRPIARPASPRAARQAINPSSPCAALRVTRSRCCAMGCTSAVKHDHPGSETHSMSEAWRS